MEIAAIENDHIPPTHIYKHHWIHIRYMITSTICFIIQVYQRISLDLFYTSCSSHTFRFIKLKIDTHTNIHIYLKCKR
jgi:hypothetical protein